MSSYELEETKMRGDIKESILFLFKEEDITLFNKAELSRRYNCDPRTIERYIKMAKGEIEVVSQKREYKSKLEEFKPIIINKVDKYGCTAKAVYQLILNISREKHQCSAEEHQ